MKIGLTNDVSKDIFYSLAPLNFLLRTAALSNTFRDGTKLPKSWSITKSLFYATVLSILNLLCLYEKIKTFKGDLRTGIVRFADSVQLIYWFPYLEYIVDMYFIFKYGRESALKYFKVFDNIDSIIGMPNYDKIRKDIVKVIGFSLVVSVWICIFDYFSWVLVENWHSPTVYSIEYIYFFLNMLSVLDIISHVIQLQYRLKMFEDFLQNISFANFNKHLKDDENGSIEECSGSVAALNTSNKCYLLLLKQVDYINKSYGFRVLVYCVNLLFNTINLLNVAIRIVNGSLPPAGGDVTIVTASSSFVEIVLPTIASVFRAFNYVLLIILLLNRCQQIYKQSDIIIDQIDEMLANNYEDVGFRRNLLEFRNLLITRPIKFHAAKFFTMDYTLLVSLTSVIVTYTIIMLQSME